MQAINGFENTQALHGRQQALQAGPHIISIVRVKPDVTGYGANCLKVVYDIAEGEGQGRFAQYAYDEESDWRHQIEVDLDEQNGARLKALLDALEPAVPGFTAAFVSDWNEQRLVNQIVGVIFQERKITVSKGKNKGKDRSYLDLWDFVPAQAIRTGEVNYTPPVNDRRENKGDAQQPVAAPVAMQAPQAPMAPQPQQQMPAQQPMAPQAPQYQQPMQPQAPMAQPQYQQQPVAAPPQMMQPQAPVQGVYDQDIPF